MNDFSELENQLGKLRPVQPSPALIERIERGLAEPEMSTPAAGALPRERRFHFNWLCAGLGLAGATALVLFAFVRTQQVVRQTPAVASTRTSPVISSSTAQFIPAGLTQVVYRTRDEGVHFPTNSSQPLRRVRSHTQETFQWRNPKTGATLKISYPTERVSLLPISGQ
jgi:hypothetical protein